MDSNYKKLIISLIVIFSFIFAYSIFSLFKGLVSAKNELDKKNNYNQLLEIITSDSQQNVYNNYVINASYIENGINLSLYIEGDNPYLIIKGTKTIEYKLIKTLNDNYKIDLDLSNLNNGAYIFYIKLDKEYPLINKLDLLEQIIRRKINNKLVTFSYENNHMILKIEDFKYDYDILIDPGHGGDDIGTYNSIITEADLNLKQSLYEKERYEQHGFKVLLSRNDDTSGMMMGDISNWNKAKQRGYAIGYYGVTSKIVYSNHHNASENKKYTGFEILVSNKLDENDLSSELKILNELLNKYHKDYQNNRLKMYSRDIEDGSTYDKSKGKIYNYTDYYATIRIPLELFNVKTVTYEGCYMTNNDNFNWYYKSDGWKIMSEIKIKNYVESLGKTYIPV